MPRHDQPRTTDGPLLRGLRSTIDRDHSPVDLYPQIGDERWSDLSLSRATWAFVALGVLIRSVRIGLVHPLWGDECFIGANLIGRGYLGLLRPLDYQQVAPFLFLWTELTAVKLFGFSEWSLRAFPTACSIGSLLLFRHLAGRVMKGLPLLFAVAILAVAINPIRHGGEAKPYAVDFLVATSLMTFVVEWWRQPDRATWLWVLAGSTPIALGFSLPAIFVVGGISLALSREVWRLRKAQITAAYLAFNAAIAVGSLVVIRSGLGQQPLELKEYMDHYWSTKFPPLGNPPRLGLWLIQAHTGHLVTYPVGGANGGGVLTLICVVAGSVGLWLRKRSLIVVAGLAPLGLALVASTFRAYPYGETERLMQFIGPAICLLAGFGLARIVGRPRRPGIHRWLVGGFLVGFVSLGVGLVVADLLAPSKTPHDLEARDFARRFWSEIDDGAEVACVRVDLGLDFEKGPTHHGRSADYLCYQQIYSDRHRKGDPLDWGRISGSRPLRCVLFDGVPVDSPLFVAWMGEMARHYQLTGTRTLRANPGVAPTGVSFEDHLAVLEFVPRGRPVDPADLARLARAVELEPRPGTLRLASPRPGLLP